MLEQLKREQDEEVEKVQGHLEAVTLAVRELEENMRTLQLASAATENIVLTEVRSQLGQKVLLTIKVCLKFYFSKITIKL